MTTDLPFLSVGRPPAPVDRLLGRGQRQGISTSLSFFGIFTPPPLLISKIPTSLFSPNGLFGLRFPLHRRDPIPLQISLHSRPQKLRVLEMSSEAVQIAKVYRQLLQALKKHIGKEESKKHFVEYVAQEFREKNRLSSVQQKIKLARDYTFLLNSVHHHKDLLFSYNIAVDRSEEMKRVLGKSAASVGLQLPEVYQP